uniref:Uncharacterized protein n=1 Tax=Klebsiella pneumoniae TaxID=573 RepID=A0A8B0SWZ1_KLEPN|nr:hypothetical protein [Klebsiella pneumoniae]
MQDLRKNQQKKHLPPSFRKVDCFFLFPEYLCVLSRAKPDTEFHAELLSH